MFWVIAVIVILVLGVGGAAFPANGGPNGSGCDRCKELPFYWRSLKWYQMIWMGVYMFFLWLNCKAMGC